MCEQAVQPVREKGRGLAWGGQVGESEKGWAKESREYFGRRAYCRQQVSEVSGGDCCGDS